MDGVRCTMTNRKSQELVGSCRSPNFVFKALRQNDSKCQTFEGESITSWIVESYRLSSKSFVRTAFIFPC